MVLGLTASNPPKSVRAAVLPCEDEVQDQALLSREPLALEDQYFGIIYQDPEGFESTRAVIARAVKFNADGVPYLCVFCCERRAYREFRVDRIVECWDAETGETEDPQVFLLETIGFDINQRAHPADIDTRKMRDVFELIRPHVVLLGALSKCDRYMHVAEVEVIRGHLVGLLASSRISDDEWKQIETRIRRVRPSSCGVAEAYEDLRRRTPQELTAFMIAAVAVARADKKVKPEEIEMLNDLAEELLGLSVHDLIEV